MIALDRFRHAVEAASAELENARRAALDLPSAVYFYPEQAIEFGLWDDGSKNREGVSRVLKVDREQGLVELDTRHPSIASGDFVFTSPPGMQIDSTREHWTRAVEAEVKLMREVGDRLLKLARGDR